MKINSAVSLELLSIMRHFTLNGLLAGFCTVEDMGAVPEDMLLAVLPEAEKARSNSFQIGEERRHFLFRRCFQQVFVAQQIGWQGEMNMLSLVHGRDRSPHCTDAPGLKLSFTSSGKTCLFGAAENADLGVDVERERNVLNAPALAQRFFTAHEAHDVANRPAVEQSLHFLTLWSAKEAGLKALGKGVVDGLNTLTFAKQHDQWVIRHSDEALPAAPWRLSLPDWLPGHIVAILHRFSTL